MLTRSRLQELLNYDTETGIFLWRVTNSRRAQAGSFAGHVTRYGYIEISVDGCRAKAHRLAWLYIYGALPVEQIDHINGNRADNRIKNLREAKPFENNGNMKRPRHNKSGVKGVYWDASRARWHAQIQIAGRSKSLGRFVDIREAQAAYQKAAVDRFGEFARLA